MGEQCPPEAAHVISTAPLLGVDLSMAFDRWMTGVRPVFAFFRAVPFVAAMCRSSTEYIDSASRTQQVLGYLRLIRRRRRTATLAAVATARNENRRADGACTDGTAAAAVAEAARRLIERAFSHICSSSLITLPLRAFLQSSGSNCRKLATDILSSRPAQTATRNCSSVQ